MPESQVFLKGASKVDLRRGWAPPEERAAFGKKQRGRVGRRALGTWEPADELRDPVEVVMACAVHRQTKLIPIRTARMAVSPFAFYRGGATLMADDMARYPHTGIMAQTCGDAHLSNFGLYASPERTPVFDINDFDETSQGPWEWDLKRLATSFALVARENGQPQRAEEAVRAVVYGYLRGLTEMAQLGWLERRHRMIRADIPVTADTVWTKKQTATLTKVVSKAKGRTQSWTVAKFCETVDGQPRLRTQPPLLTGVSRRSASAVTLALRTYLASLSVEHRAYVAGYHVVDVAHKVVGVGSVGTYDYIVLLQGDGDGDRLLLQVKEAELSAVKAALGDKPILEHGERVVVGSWLMQAVSDPFLGWTRLHDRAFYVRQLKDMKGGVEPTALRSSVLVGYANRCGFALAAAHSRAGDPDVVLGYTGQGTALYDGIWAFANAYADQTERDYARFTAAIAEGRLKVSEVF